MLTLQMRLLMAISMNKDIRAGVFYRCVKYLHMFHGRPIEVGRFCRLCFGCAEARFSCLGSKGDILASFRAKACHLR